MQTIILTGNLGRDPELKTFDNGKIATTSLAVTEKYKDRNGTQIINTEWFNLVFRDRTAEVLCQFCKKGSKVLVIGKQKTRTYTGNDGQERRVVEIVCSSLEMLNVKESEVNAGEEARSLVSSAKQLASQPQYQQYQQPRQSQPTQPMMTAEETDPQECMDLPF